jgi:hypothetical protein
LQGFYKDDDRLVLTLSKINSLNRFPPEDAWFRNVSVNNAKRTIESMQQKRRNENELRILREKKPKKLARRKKNGKGSDKSKGQISRAKVAGNA